MDKKIPDYLLEHYNIQTNSLVENKIMSILESQEAIYKDEMKKFFPSIWNEVKGQIQFIIPFATTRLGSEEKLLSKYIKGLDLEIRLNHSPVRNAYTYPWIDGKWKATLTNIPTLGWIYYLTNGYAQVFSNQNLLIPKVTGDSVTFSQTKGMKVMAFQTKGLLTDLDERQRTAIMLHEIGHWYRGKSAMTATLASLTNMLTKSIFPPLAFFTLIVYNLISRHAEKSADLFAKECGFGNDLASALDKILLRPRTDVSWINSLNDWIIKIIMHIQNVLDKIAPFLFNYPSAEKRKKYLQDNYLYAEEIQLEELCHVEKLINEGVIKDLSLKLLQKPLNMVDAKISKNLNILFPVK